MIGVSTNSHLPSFDKYSIMRYYQFKPILLEYRRDITSKNYGEKLIAIGKQQGVESLEEILSQLEAMDPTANKQYVEWLARNFIARKFRLEDSPRVRDDLQTFISVKNRLPTDERDLGRRIKSVVDGRNEYIQLDYEWLKGRMDQINNVEIGDDKPVANSGTFPVIKDIEVLSNTPLGLLAIPKTVEASCELGSGTRWCTASRKNNMFNHYNKRSPLYVWRDKNGEKYQFWFNTQWSQFMDARDNSLDKDTINSFWNHPVIGKLFKQNIDKIGFKYLPENLKTPELCEKAVELSGRALEYVPEKLKTPELCEKAVELSGRALEYVPEKLKTPELCEKAVEAGGSEVLKYVPDKLLSSELYMKLVDKHGPIKFRDVPDKFKTPELCLAAVKQDGYELEYVPDKFITPEMCNEVAKQFRRQFDWSYESSLLGLIPDKFKTPEMCKRAVSKDGLALGYVPEDMKTPEICLTAGDQNGDSARFLPEKLKTPEFYKALVKLDGRALAHVPDEMKSPELCKLAIKNNWHAFYSIPDNMKTLRTYADILVSNVFSPAVYRNNSDEELEGTYNPMTVIPPEHQKNAKNLAYGIMSNKVIDNPALLEKIKNNYKDSFWFKKGDIEKIKSIISSTEELEFIQNKMSNSHHRNNRRGYG